MNLSVACGCSWPRRPVRGQCQPAIIVIDPRDAAAPPLCVVLLRLERGRITHILDFRYAPDAAEAIDWATVYPHRRDAPSA